MKSSYLPRVLLGVAGLITISMWAFMIITTSNQSTAPIDTPRPSFSLQTEQKQVALWFGDSFVEGAGASTKSKGFSYRVSQHYGLFHKNLAQGASGYIGNREEAIKRCGKEDCLTLIKALEKKKMLRADVIFIQAGLNDYALTPENSKSVEDFYTKLRITYPSSIVITLSPTKAFPEDDLQKKIQLLAKKYVTSIGGFYVDLGEPLVGHPEWLSADNFHPNDLGYEVLANLAIEKTTPILEKILSGE